MVAFQIAIHRGVGGSDGFRRRTEIRNKVCAKSERTCQMRNVECRLVGQWRRRLTHSMAATMHKVITPHR